LESAWGILNDLIGRIADRPVLAPATAGLLRTGLSPPSPCTAECVKGFGRLRTKASSAGTRGPHALVYG